MGKEVADPGKKAVGGVILGGQRFVKRALKRLKREAVGTPEIVHRGELLPRVGPEEILRLVGEQYDETREEMLDPGRRERRQVAMHLLRTRTGMTNGARGELCGGISSSAVSQALRRCVARAEANQAFAKRMAAIERRLTCQGLTPQPDPRMAEAAGSKVSAKHGSVRAFAVVLGKPASG